MFIDDLSASSALVIDPNPTSRAILVSQLRDFGVGQVAQSARLVDARRQLEYRKFDVVLCEHHFPLESMSGQDLLDDLRRNQLLPFSTVFIMVTGEATYAKVAEAAESALDGYLLKPHKATQLGDRLLAARERKKSLEPIFAAIDAEDFPTAARLCVERFHNRGKFWLYAARVGAELLLRLGQFDQAQKLYQAVVDCKTLPWAKLGVARALLDEGQTGRAVSTLEALIHEDHAYTDAYDVLGRAQFEQGKFDDAMGTFKLAATLTPHSVTRLQNLALMTFYAGQTQAAEPLLDRTVRLGLDSKMFDAQSLVLLAFVRLQLADHKGLQRCADDIHRLIERDAENDRLVRLSTVIDALVLIDQGQHARVVGQVRALCAQVREPDFDFESAANLLTLLGQLAARSIQLDEVEAAVDALALRFCGTRALAELMAGTAAAHPPYAERVRAAHAQVMKAAEAAMSLSMAGKPEAAVLELIRHGQASCSGKLIETAYLVLHRHADRIGALDALTAQVHDLRSRFKTHFSRASLGEQKRAAGGLTLRVGTAKPKAPPLPLHETAVPQADAGMAS